MPIAGVPKAAQIKPDDAFVQSNLGLRASVVGKQLSPLRAGGPASFPERYLLGMKSRASMLEPACLLLEARSRGALNERIVRLWIWAAFRNSAIASVNRFSSCCRCCRGCSGALAESGLSAIAFLKARIGGPRTDGY